jgi:hypothetical protein
MVTGEAMSSVLSHVERFLTHRGDGPLEGDTGRVKDDRQAEDQLKEIVSQPEGSW